VLGVLEANCAKCHGAGTVAQAGIDYILDLEKLIATGKVVPGEPESSRIYLRMSAAVSPMPPKSEMQRPVASDIESVKKWIDECAGVQSCGDQEFIPMRHRAQADQRGHRQHGERGQPQVHPLLQLRAPAQRRLVRRGDRAVPPGPGQAGQQPVAGDQIKAPVAIDEQKPDLPHRHQRLPVDRGGREFQLSEPSVYFRDRQRPELGKQFTDVWEMIADQNPYTVEYLGDGRRGHQAAETETNVPIMQGDAFIDVASRSPLYYDILDIPLRSGKLRDSEDPDCDPAEHHRRVPRDPARRSTSSNIEAEIVEDDDVVARAGFRCRTCPTSTASSSATCSTTPTTARSGSATTSAGQSGKQNISEHPLDFDFDGGEIIFNLPNGLQGYMLTDADGNRLDEGPINIVQDESQKDFLVRNGVSCMGCHSAGMIKVQDDIRYDLDAGQTETTFDAIEKDQIRRLYPRRDRVRRPPRRGHPPLQRLPRPRRRHRRAEKEPVLTTFLAFDENVTLRRAGAEYDLTEKDMVQAVGKLSDDLGSDLAEGNTIQRRDFTNNFPAERLHPQHRLLPLLPRRGRERGRPRVHRHRHRRRRRDRQAVIPQGAWPPPGQIWRPARAVFFSYGATNITATSQR
jgi:hypothetical protein